MTAKTGKPPGNPNWVKGGKSPNPAGMTKEQKQAKDIVKQALSSAAFGEAWEESYLNGLKKGNPHLLKDFADRIGGKAVEKIEVSGIERPFTALTNEELLALAKSRLEPKPPEPDKKAPEVTTPSPGKP